MTGFHLERATFDPFIWRDAAGRGDPPRGGTVTGCGRPCPATNTVINGLLNCIETHPGTAAWVQAIGAIIALLIAIFVPWWQQRMVRKAEQEAKDRELAGLRLALYTEVRMVAEACLQQLSIAGDAAHTDRRLSRMPLPVFHGNSGKIGLLTVAEIPPLLNLSFTLSDMAEITSDMPMGVASMRDLETLPKMQATACEHAAEFLEVVPNIPVADTQEVIAALKKAAAQHL